MTMPTTDQVRMFHPGTTTLSGVEGPREAPAWTVPMVPGLAVVMTQFGEFNVTHVASGMSMSGVYERAGSAAHVLAQFAAIGHAYRIDYAGDGLEVIAAMRACGGEPVPFDGATSTSQGETRPLTVGEWLQCVRGDDLGDEFPWESWDENPLARAGKLLDTLPLPTFLAAQETAHV